MGPTTAIPITAQAQWNINFAQDQLEVTAMGDDTKQYVSDLANVTGGFSGFHDDADTGSQIWTAATNGVKQKFYLYPDASTNTKYFHGEINVASYDAEGGVGNAVTANVTWNAASNIVFKYA